EVTVVSYLDEEVQEVCIKVISCDGKKRDSIAFHNIPENETVPKTGDPGRTRNYAGLLMMSAGGLWITMTGRRKIR
ncbi:MAG: hypothetical protein K6A77_07195, partial [Clostridiales bacterium]|nr:hypothetical protein [Clostridiales bacterium]